MTFAEGNRANEGGETPNLKIQTSGKFKLTAKNAK
jgi:hypothetical protein